MELSTTQEATSCMAIRQFPSISCNKEVNYRVYKNWRTIPCRLSAAACSIYSQLPFVAGGCPSICHAVVTRDPSDMEIKYNGCN
jgi:hypothetical protein